MSSSADAFSLDRAASGYHVYDSTGYIFRLTFTCPHRSQPHTPGQHPPAMAAALSRAAGAAAGRARARRADHLTAAAAERQLLSELEAAWAALDAAATPEVNRVLDLLHEHAALAEAAR